MTTTTGIFCGCCGRGIDRSRDWCSDCEKHVAPRRFDVPAWERTYLAVHGKECPFQEINDSATEGKKK